tara:strand:+ start:372 stop:509 length:138 start_codon:yes stop_codon:yes gene_type:complete
MGSIIFAHCQSCNFGDSYFVGSGMNDSDVDSVIHRLPKGAQKKVK